MRWSPALTSAAVPPLILLLLVVPPASAQQPFATLDAPEVSAAGATWTGLLAGAAWTPGDPQATPLAPSPPVEVPGFALAAAWADVTVYHVERSLASDLRSEPPTRWTLANVTSAGASGDSKDARLVAIAAGGRATVSSGPLSIRLVPAPAGSGQFPGRVSGAPDSSVGAGASLLVERHGDGFVEVRGSFRLIVDGLDFTLDSDGGPRRLQTTTDVDGAEVETAAGSYATHATVHEAVLDLQDAVVRLPASEVFVTQATASSEGPWKFQEATGSLSTPDGPAQVSGDVEVDGAVSGFLRRSHDKVEATLSGAPTGLLVDGQSTALATSPAAQPSPVAWASMAAGAVIFAGLAYAAVGRWRFSRLDRAMDRADYLRALGLAEGLRGHPRLAQDATLAAAISLLGLGRPAEALARLVARGRWAAGRWPTREFLLARAEAALGHRDEARHHLASSVLAEPALLSQAQADPVLAAILPAPSTTPAGEAYA